MRTRALLLCLALYFPCTAYAESYGRYFSVVRDIHGETVPSATVTVYLAGTGTIATIYSSLAGAPLGNPFLSDAFGNYSFYVPPGLYKIVVTKVGVGTFTTDQIPVGTQVHGERHASIGADPLVLSGIFGELADAQKVTVSNSGVPAGIRSRLNFGQSGTIGSSASDDGSEVDILLDVLPESITSSHLTTNSVGTDEVLNGALTNDDVSTIAGIAESKLSLSFPTHSTANDPTAGQKAALAGSFGTPGSGNTYVTDADPRNIDPRVPLPHAASHAAAGDDPISVSTSQIEGWTGLLDHHLEHEDGGDDEVSVQGLSGVLADPQTIVVKSNGITVSSRSAVNFQEGGNTVLTVTDDPGNNRVNVKIDAIVPGQESFSAVSVPTGTNPVADIPGDTLNVLATGPIIITGNQTTDSLTFAIVQGSGTDVTDDLEEELHSSEHSVSGDDTIAATDLSSVCIDSQVLGGTTLVGGVECQTDDDQPDSDSEVPNDLTVVGGTISTSTIDISSTATPTPVAEGRIQWDSDDDRIAVGNGSGTTAFYSGPHTVDTNASTICNGTTTYLDGDGNCDTEAAGTDLTADLEEESHHLEHEDGGDDEVSVQGLSGVLADPQTVVVRKDGAVIGTRSSINFVSGSGASLTVADNIGNTRVDVTVAVVDDSHNHTGATISGLDAADTTTGTFDVARLPSSSTTVTGVVRLATDSESNSAEATASNDARLSDARTPTAHTTSHKHGGSDEVATATPAANAIPKAGSGSTLATGFLGTGTANSSRLLRGDGTWSGTLTASGGVPTAEPGQANLGASPHVLGIVDGTTGTPVTDAEPTALFQRVGSGSGTVIPFQYSYQQITPSKGYHYMSDYFLRMNSPYGNDSVASSARAYYEPFGLVQGLAATPSASGGSLATATYTYSVSSIASGEETIGSQFVDTAVTGPTGSVSLTWTALGGASSYKVYRRRVDLPDAVAVWFAAATNSFTDTGAAGTSGNGRISTVWGIWAQAWCLAHVGRCTTGEFDAINNGGRAAPQDLSFPGAISAVQLVSSGTADTSAGLDITADETDSRFHTGITFGQYSIRSYGIDFLRSDVAASAIRLANTQALVSRNAAGTADVTALLVSSANEVSLGGQVFANSSTGKVGLLTAAPTYRVHAQKSEDATATLAMQNSNTGTQAVASVLAKSDTAEVAISSHAAARGAGRYGVAIGGYGELLNTSGNGLLVGTNYSAPIIIGTNNTARMTIAAAGQISLAAPYVDVPATTTIADEGTGAVATATLTPTTAGFHFVVCNDANGCTLTLGESGILSGQRLTLVTTSTAAVTVNDTAGVTELAGAWVGGQFDSLVLVYLSDRFAEISRSNN